MTDPLLPIIVSQHMEAMGPATGLPALRALFPDVTRSDLQDAQRRYRRKWHHDHAIMTEQLQWMVPGTVWASDFSESPVPIDSCFGNLLVSRDLASSFQLQSLPTVTPDAKTAVDAMELLFRAHGAPLVHKSDNGSPFISEAFRELLEEWQVIILLSPPRTPRYNGAIEAGCGALKLRIHQRASEHGRNGQWTSDDVEVAGRQCNCTLRPWGPAGPTPLEAWQKRPVITPDQRTRFADCLAAMRCQVLEEHGMADEPLSLLARAAVARESIHRALVQLGYSSVQRKRITPPFNSPLRYSIT